MLEKERKINFGEKENIRASERELTFVNSSYNSKKKKERDRKTLHVNLQCKFVLLWINMPVGWSIGRMKMIYYT